MSWDITNPTYGGTSTGGTKTVYAQFHDRTGKWSDNESDTITYSGGGGGGTSAYSNAVLADSPVAYWRLGEAAGTTAADSAGGNPGTYTNNPQLGAAALVASDAANKAMRLDGVSQHARVANSGSLSPTAQVSVDAWIKPDGLPATGSFATVASKREAYALQFNGSRLEFTIMQGGVRKRAQAPAGAIQVGSTYHVAGTYDGTTARLYINGTEVAALPLTGAIGTTSAGVNIGSWSGTNEFFRGTIDDVAVYASALTAARVKAHNDIGGGATPPPPPVSAPSNLSASAASSSQINLTWSDNADNETEFVLQRSTSSDFSAAASIPLPENATSYSDTGRAASTTYHYRLKAQNASASSGWSNAASATTQSAPPATVAAPTNLNAGAVSTSQINLTWTENANNETGLTLERSTSPAFTSPTAHRAGRQRLQLLGHRTRGRPPRTTTACGRRTRPQRRAGPTARAPPPRTSRRRPTTPPRSARTTRSPGGGWANRRAPRPWTRRRPTRAPTSTARRSAQPSLLPKDAANKAVSFDGVNDSVGVNNSASINISTPITLEAWVRPTVLPPAGSFASIVAKPEQYALQFNGPLLEFTIMQMGSRRRLQAPAGTVVAGQTYHVVGHLRRHHPAPVRERHAGRVRPRWWAARRPPSNMLMHGLLERLQRVPARHARRGGRVRHRPQRRPRPGAPQRRRLSVHRRAPAGPP